MSLIGVPTIDDVARQAGVSRSTVSLVLNARPGLHPDTVASVRRVISELGYAHASPGRRRGGRDRGRRATNRIALLTPGIPRASLNSPVYMDVLHGVEAAVRESGRSLVLVHLDSGQPCPSPLFPQKVDGVVLFRPTADPRLARRLGQYPCVQVMGRVRPDDAWDHVTYDNARLGLLAAEFVLSRGHRRAGFVSASRAELFAERGHRFHGALAAAGAASADYIDDALQDETGSVIRVVPERVDALLDQVLAATPRPTALFLAADTLAPAICAGLQRRGVALGEGLDVISCNNEQMLLAHLHPRPATIDIHAELVGRRAVGQLLWRIAHPRDPRAVIALEPSLVSEEQPHNNENSERTTTKGVAS